MGLTPNGSDYNNSITNNNKGYTILIIDDDELILRLLKKRLEKLNFEVITTSKDDEAIKLALKNIPDIILLDVLLNKLDGFEVCKIFRQNSKLRDIPIIFLTGKIDSESIIRGLKLGGNDYVTKPYEFEVLVARIKLHLDFQVKRHRLNQSQIEQQIILDSIPAIIFYKDKENRMLRVNDAFCKAMGANQYDLVKKSCCEIWPDIAEHYWKDDKEVMNTGKPKRNILETITTPTGTIYVQTDKIPYIDQNNKIIGIIGFSIDITERKKAEDKLKEYTKELEKMNDLMVGRELKMIEMKNEIKELKNEIDILRNQ